MAIVPSNLPLTTFLFSRSKRFSYVYRHSCSGTVARLQSSPGKLPFFGPQMGGPVGFFLEATAHPDGGTDCHRRSVLALPPPPPLDRCAGESSRNCRAPAGVENCCCCCPITLYWCASLCCFVHASLGQWLLRGRRLDEYSVNSSDRGVASRTSHRLASSKHGRDRRKEKKRRKFATCAEATHAITQ